MTKQTQDDTAEKLSAEGDWQGLAEHLQAQLDAGDPGYHDIAMRLAKVHEEHLQQKREAGDTLEWLLTKSPSDTGVRHELERLRGEVEDWAGLIRAYRLGMAAESDPATKLEFLERIARVSSDAQADIAQTRAVAIEALVLEPECAWAWATLFESHEADESWWELVKELTKAAMKTTASAGPITLHIATVMDECLGQGERAATLYEAAIESGANALVALEGLEALYAEAEAWDKLAHTYERLLPHALDTEERVTIQSNWAMVLADGLGDIPGALALYDQILEEAPEDKEAFQAMLALQKRAE